MFICKSWFHILAAVVLKEHFYVSAVVITQDCLENKATKESNVVEI
jgi:hypothetical protein